jgi:hypothetical protein
MLISRHWPFNPCFSTNLRKPCSYVIRVLGDLAYEPSNRSTTLIKKYHDILYKEQIGSGAK